MSKVRRDKHQELVIYQKSLKFLDRYYKPYSNSRRWRQLIKEFKK